MAVRFIFATFSDHIRNRGEGRELWSAVGAFAELPKGRVKMPSGIAGPFPILTAGLLTMIEASSVRGDSGRLATQTCAVVAQVMPDSRFSSQSVTETVPNCE